MKVIEQASQAKGTIIVTKFDDGSRVTHYADSRLATNYRSAPNNGMSRALYPATAAKKCALMDKLAAAGIR